MIQIEQHNRSPLLERPLSSTLAFRTDERGRIHPVSATQFLADVLALVPRLPAQPVAINVCRDRYNFTVAFCAVIVKGQANALPPSHQREVQAQTAKRVGDCYVLHDGVDELADLPCYNLAADIALDVSPGRTNDTGSTGGSSAEISQRIPQIPLSQISAICFTSGSTGEPTATQKSWHTLQQSSRINHRHYLDGIAEPISLLATVPPQHMYGLETSVLLPLVADVAVHHAQPLLPANIADCLAAIPTPSILVSTPIHMQAVVDSGVALTPAELFLSATAPLSANLASAVADLTGAKAREIFGCSEAGSLATRDLLTDPLWYPFDGIEFVKRGEQTWIESDHLLSSVELQDRIEFYASGGFKLLGRQSDMVNVAGKRGSLSALTALLMENPDVEDAVIFAPERNDASSSVNRLAALVVSSNQTARQIQNWLRQRVDHAFVPRPIVFTDALPRSSTGKLPRNEVLRQFELARKKNDAV